MVGPADQRLFLTDFRYLTQSAEQLDAGWRREIAPEILQAVARPSSAATARRSGWASTTRRCRSRTTRTLDGQLAEGVELVAAGGLIEELRAVKDADELDKIRAAAKLADAALTEVLGRGLAGRTERDVALDLEVTMRKAGAEAVSFPPIVAVRRAQRAAARRAARRRDPGATRW